LVCVDAPIFQRKGATITGSCLGQWQNKLYHRALGIVDVHAIFGSHATVLEHRLDLIICLTKQIPLTPLLKPKLDELIIFDVALPRLLLSIAFTQNPAILIESAVQWVLSQQFQRMEHENIPCD
jgi:serine kinase of HPr protein (carbohydrate metabolism regulator)